MPSLPSLKSFPSFFSLRSSSTSTAVSVSSPTPTLARSSTDASTLTASSSATLIAPTLSAYLGYPSDPKLAPADLDALAALSPYASDRPTQHYTPADAPPGFAVDTNPLFVRRPARTRRVDDVVSKGLDASRLLQSISSSMDVESLQLVASSCLLLFDTVQTVRTNRTQCHQLLERVHQIVRALINLCGDAQARGRPIGDDGNGGGGGGGYGGVAPPMARAIDAFAETLHTLHGLLQSLAHAGLFARILRGAEMRAQLGEVGAALGAALELFEVKTSLLTHAALGGARKAAAERHAELLRALGRGREGERV
ncbi:hypothetical protein C8R46DRAFT_1042881 [Mycena filopes]|nr:hypothetical protein C8R46DRAFT_1042881 [Mycena filopes]